MADINLTVTIPDALTDRVWSAFSNSEGYYEIEASERPSPKDFLEAWIKSQLKQITRKYEARQAQILAEQAANNDVNL